ncbi:MAG: hypothetical protein LBN94_00685, partial [Puniceicoccales bacterium]|nr:hypothetical protein [Puniceicoccales bacterium]
KLNGAKITATDIRAGAAMYLAALIAEGETTILRTDYIDRGYENFEGKLRALGATIEPVLLEKPSLTHVHMQ